MADFQVLQSNPPPELIDLGLGSPDFSLLPLELIQRSAEKYFEVGDKRALAYGLEQGDGYLRHSLAEFLTGSFGSHVDPDALFITSGASAALDLFCTLLTQPGDAVLVEDPTYFLALRVFEDHKLRPVPISMDQDGLLLDGLEAKIIEHKPKFIYTIPAFHNPTGRTLSQDRRQRLVALVQKHNMYILADEVYHLLAYSGAPPNPFAAYSGDVEQVVSINSFSKLLAPGLRLGWVQAHPKVIRMLVASALLDSGGGMNPFTSGLLRELVASGDLESHVELLHQEYAQRLEAMDSALREHLPAAKWVTPQGGFFFWLHLPGVDASDLRQKALYFNVGLRQGGIFSARQGFQDHIRLCFSFYDLDRISQGIKSLGECVRDLFR